MNEFGRWWIDWRDAREDAPFRNIKSSSTSIKLACSKANSSGAGNRHRSPEYRMLGESVIRCTHLDIPEQSCGAASSDIWTRKLCVPSLSSAEWSRDKAHRPTRINGQLRLNSTAKVSNFSARRTVSVRWHTRVGITRDCTPPTARRDAHAPRCCCPPLPPLRLTILPLLLDTCTLVTRAHELRLLLAAR